ncbi:MAG: RidA family protein [Planctomycetota bacterium]
MSSIRGEVGTDLTVAEAQVAAKSALLDILAIIKNEIGDLDKIVAVEKLVGFVRSVGLFTERPQVIDGASNLLIAFLERMGATRELPREWHNCRLGLPCSWK